MDQRKFSTKLEISWCKHCRDDILISLHNGTVIPRHIQTEYHLRIDEDCRCDILNNDLHAVGYDIQLESMVGWLCYKSDTLKLTNTCRRAILKLL